MIYRHVICGAEQNVTDDSGNVSNSLKDSEYTLVFTFMFVSDDKLM